MLTGSRSTIDPKLVKLILASASPRRARPTHREPDRCATYIWIRDEALEKLGRHLGVEGQDAVERVLKIDRWRNVAVELDYPPDYEARVRRFVPDEFANREGVEIAEDGREARESLRS